MQLRLIYISCRARGSYRLPAFDDIALLDQDLVRVRIGGHILLCVANENEVAETRQLVADISDNAIFRGLDRGSFRNGDRQALIHGAVALRAELPDDQALDGLPERFAHAGQRVGERGFADGSWCLTVATLTSAVGFASSDS